MKPPKPVAAYINAVRVGNLVFSAGQGPFADGEWKYRGKVGKDISLEEAYEAAKICALNCLSAIKAEIGDLNEVKKVVKITGFVNSANGFSRQPEVINGASELLIKIFDERGQHARSAIGVNELYKDISVELEMIVEVSE